MRTKTLLLSAVALAAGLISSQAQNVYSANVVGYVNVPLATGFTLVGNQLDLDGTGTNNTILTVVGTNLPPLTKVLAWNTNTSTYASITLNAAGVWSAGAAGPIVKAALQPGGGVFVQIPASSGPTNITLVGNVLQQTNMMGLVTGFQIASYPFPIGGGLTTNLNYIPNPSSGSSHDRALTWNVGSQTFTTHIWGTSSWSAGDPQLGVGGAVFLQPYQPNVWTNSFVVQ